MDKNICKFIDSRRAKSETHFTHVSQIQPTGRYYIGRKDVEEFWKLYCDTLYNNPDMISGVAESPNNFVPVVNDTDIKINYNSSIHKLDRKLYKDNHIHQTAIIYQKHIKSLVKNYKPINGICFVLEKDRPTIEDKTISHGFHLHFPYTIMNKVDIDIHLVPRIRREVSDKNLFKDLEIENSENCIDKKIASKQWLLYGSRKKENKQYYKLTKIFDDNMKEISLQEALKEYTLYDISEDEIKMDESKLEYYLPRILSITPINHREVEVKTDLDLITKSFLKKAKESKKIYEDLPTSDALKKAKELMKLISSARADNYDDWMDIGWLLYSIGDGSDEAFEMWLEFSEKTSSPKKFSEKVCLYEWEHMEKKDKTIGSLYFYARQDSPELYKNIQKADNKRLCEKSLNGGHYDMAKLLHNKYRDEFVCACNEKRIWYKYVNHRWIFDKKGHSLMQKIPNELVKDYETYRKQIKDQIGDEEDEDDNADQRKKIKIISKIIANLKSTPFINNVMKACEDLLFLDDTFLEKLDTNPNLMHFTNGILDLTDMKFRSGFPKDYLSLSTGYDFPTELSSDSLEVMEVNDHLIKTFPDPELRQYFIEYCADMLRGGNSRKTFITMTGEGDNGKSINMDLLKLVLGRYMRILPTSLIVGKRSQSSQATPELSGIQGVRHTVLQEPEGKDVINTGVLKELSGNDEIYIRGLYKESQNVRPMFRLSLICNKLPRLPGDDQAVWNRIRVLQYESCFPKDPKTVPKTFEEQLKVKRFPRDNFFSDKLGSLRQAFMWVMWETYKKIKKEGHSPEPEKVREATAVYKRNNDVFLQFIEERIIQDIDNPKATMSVVETYHSFKTWFEESYPNLKSQIPSKEDMKESLIRKWGELINQKWKGFRLRTEEDDENDGKVIILREEDLSSTEDNKKITDDDEEEENNQQKFYTKLKKKKRKDTEEKDDEI